MKILIVGAGSVGQVYGYALHKAGADITFFVRPKYVESVSQGLHLYDLNRKNGLQHPIEFNQFAVVSTPAEVAEKAWDYVILCIPSTGLQGDWLPQLIDSMGSAKLISLTPGPKDRELILQHISEDRLITGMITLVAYPTPLPTEDVPVEGTAFWYPPLSPSPMEGPVHEVDKLVAFLKRGGLPAKHDPELANKAAFPNATLMPIISGLHRAGWSFSTLKQSEHLRTTCRAVKEAQLVAGAKAETRVPLAFRAFNPTALCSIISLAPSFVPFDLETYLQVHFTKVGAQTRQTLETYIAMGDQYNIPTPNLQTLLKDTAVH